jgi:N-acetyltransferase 10
MGYGSQAVDLLSSYFQGDISVDSIVKPGVFGGEGGVDDVRNSTSSSGGSSSNLKRGGEDNEEDNELLQEQTTPRKKLPPLLTALSDRPAERLHWLGVSYGLTNQLQNFWTRKGFKLCYLRQTANDLTGEHSSVVLKELNTAGMTDAPDAGWLNAYVHDYRKRMVSLMGFSFNRMEAALAVTLVDPDRILTTTSDNNNNNINSNKIATKNGLVNNAYDAVPLTAQELLSIHLSHHDMKRLELYSRNMVDHHMILDTLPTLARLVFLGRIKGLKLSSLQVVILLSTGLQSRNVDDISKELDLPVSQVLAFFNKTIRKISSR